jgi:Fic family protein
MFAPKFSNTHTISSDCSHFWSEYYDKDRRKYYDAIQSVRENEMDMTTWLEYFTEGLSSCDLYCDKLCVKQSLYWPSSW